MLLLSGTFVFAQEVIDGFRGIKWGTELEAVEIEGKEVELEYYATISGEDYYYLTEDDMQIGTARLSRIFYVFDAFDRFVKVVMDGLAESNDDINTVLTERLGPMHSYRVKSTKKLKNWEIQDVEVLLTEFRSGDYVLQIENTASEEAYEEEMNEGIEDF